MSDHAALLLNSFARLLGKELISRGQSPEEDERRLFLAPMVVVSHGLEDDPILNYGNRAAFTLWEMTPAEFLSTPSRKTAEPMHRDERARLLARTREQGYVDDYQGIRISATGRRFLIRQAYVWNLIDEQGERQGQAAAFDHWQRLD